MNNLYFSVYDKRSKNDSYEIKENFKGKLDVIKYNICNFIVKEDILNNEFNKNFSVIVDREFLLNIQNEKKLNEFFFKKVLKNKLNGILDLNVIFDKESCCIFDEHECIKEYIMSFLKFNEYININEVVSKNEMLKNDEKYINDFQNESKIKLENIKILVILNGIEDIYLDKIKEYIYKYKVVDILVMSGINKDKLKILSQSIKEINDEYGSTIDIIKRKNITEYNVYIMYSNVKYDQFSLNYILRKKSKYIDMKDEELDKYNLNIIKYSNNIEYLNTIFSRLGISIERFSKNKLGKILLDR